MIESIFIIVKILGILFLVYKIMNIAAKASGANEVNNVMGKSLSLRIGNFSAKR